MKSATAITRIRQRFLALFCLAAFLCGASGVLPALMMFVGQLDNDHHVLVSSSGESLQIRFHHAHDAAPLVNSAGGLVLDESRADSPTDHVIEFVTAGDSLLQLPSLVTLDHALQPIGAVECERLIPIARPCLAISYARPPPGEATWSRCLRSVVLLV